MRGLFRLIVVQLVAGLVLAATVDPKPEGVQTTAPTSTSSPATAAPSTTAPAKAATTTAAPKPATPATTAPAVLKNKPAGEYAYRLRVTEDGATKDYAGTLAFFTARETDGELRQLVIDDNDHAEYSTRAAFAWRADGLYLRSTEDYGIDHEEKCDFEPDVLQYPSPMMVGKQWTVSSGCDSLRFEIVSRVVRTDTVTVGGRKVAVYVIDNQGRVPV
ncbi:MAG TPA: hypothetical protein VGB03_04175, partial [Acidimicrobiales bacterium]